MAQPSIFARIRAFFANIPLTSGAKVTPVAPGKDKDGIDNRMYGAGTDIDRSQSERYNDIQDTLEAWRKNPIARRIIGLVTAYVVGDGITISSRYKPLQDFIDEFWLNDNNIPLNQAEWCDELTRSGELFIVLFTDPIDGMTYLRAIPASSIDDVTWQEGDYKTELAYHQKTEDIKGKWWCSPHHPDAAKIETPIMLHFAINRPVGAVRGEGDLTPILKWLVRYSGWLEDRVRLNAGIRSFLWIVYAPRRMFEELKTRYARTPEPGSIIIAEEGAEKWEPVTPKLQAADAEMDGRALRWYMAAGSPGLALTDLGEAEDANQATATVMKDIRSRFLKRRQAYFTWMLGEITLKAYTRSRANRIANRRACTHRDLINEPPEISATDAMALATAANDLTTAITSLHQTLGDSTEFRQLALRMFGTFTEQNIPRQEAEQIISKGEKARAAQQTREDAQQRAATRRRTTPRNTIPRHKETAHDQTNDGPKGNGSITLR